MMLKPSNNDLAAGIRWQREGQWMRGTLGRNDYELPLAAYSSILFFLKVNPRHKGGGFYD